MRGEGLLISAAVSFTCVGVSLVSVKTAEAVDGRHPAIDKLALCVLGCEIRTLSDLHYMEYAYTQHTHTTAKRKQVKLYKHTRQ